MYILTLYAYAQKGSIMKVCILSMQKIDNMGSLLQSYGLKKILESLGCEVEYMDIKKIEEDYALLGNYAQDYSNENERTGFCGKLSKIDKYIINRMRHRHAEKVQTNIFEKFRRDILHIDSVSKQYDLCVIGSDEVFNCLNAGNWGFTSQLFGNVPEAQKVITYAASCGATEYKNLPDSVSSKIANTFRNIVAFSVRDKNTLDFVSKLSEIEVHENLDPVLIYDFHNELNRASDLIIKGRYCIIYSYRNRIHNSSEINQIKRFCEKHKLKPIALGAPQFWIKDFIVCTPFQMLKLFIHANFVITDTFHGTIFSIKYAEKFAVKIRKSNKNKIEDLVDKLGIEDYVIDNFTLLDELYENKNDKNKMFNIVSAERIKSLNYLGRFI